MNQFKVFLINTHVDGSGDNSPQILLEVLENYYKNYIRKLNMYLDVLSVGISQMVLLYSNNSVIYFIVHDINVLPCFPNDYGLKSWSPGKLYLEVIESLKVKCRSTLCY